MPPLARFATVIDQVDANGNCGSVTTTWTSDRPWATGRPVVHGVPAVGRTTPRATARGTTKKAKLRRKR